MSGTRAYQQMIAAMLLSGSIGILVVESGQPASTVVFWRCVFGALTLAAYLLCVKRRSISALPLSAWAWMVASGITMTANWVFFFQAFEHAPISTVTIVYHLYPFVLIFTAPLLFGEALQKRSIGWAAVAFLGVVLITRNPWDEAGIGPAGLVFTVLALCCYSITLLIAKSLNTIEPGIVTVVQLGVGSLCLGAFQIGSFAGIGASSWFYLIVLGVLHTGVLCVLLYGAVQHLETKAVAVLSFLYPATALVLDMLFYSVRPGWLQMIGMTAIMSAVVAERLGWPGQAPTGREEGK